MIPKFKSKGWTVLPIHYSMDPEKDIEWVTRAQESYPNMEVWGREMDMDFSLTTGVRAYPKFSRELHVVPHDLVPYNVQLPLCIGIDFNVGLMCLPVVQIKNNNISMIDEILSEPASIQDQVTDFRRMFPAHPAEIWIYGDATGSARSVQSKLTDYDILRDCFRGYCSPVVMHVPVANPPVHDRINAVNRVIQDPDGLSRLFVSDKCEYMISDFLETLRDHKGKIKKVNRPDDPYSRHSHGTDAFGYMMSMRFPVSSEVLQNVTKPSKQPVYKNVWGSMRDRRPMRRRY